MTNTNPQLKKEKANKYNNNYRASSLSYFIKTLLSVIVTGNSPFGSASYYRIKKTNK